MNLYEITSLMSGCNGFQIKARNKWPKIAPKFDIDQLEEQALRIHESDVWTFADGEVDDVSNIVESYGIKELDDFLGSVFDGDLHKKFAIN
jgi:hypothetical protein